MEASRQRFELLAKRFDEWLKAIHYSPHTRLNYRWGLRLFLDWLAENAAVEAISAVTAAHLRQYQVGLVSRECEKRPGKLSIGSQACLLAAVVKFFDWLTREQLIVYNPASSLQKPKQPARLPRNVMTPGEVRRLLDSMPVRKPRDIRDRAILEILYGTGIRLSELLGLSLYDLDLEALTLTVRHGKGDRDRMVPLTESAKTALLLYLEEARGVFAQEASQTQLFVSSRSGGPLDHADIPRIIRKAARRAGIGKHITPHSFRHACATHLLKGKADIRQIQKILGHRRLSSTEIYTRVEIGDLREVVNRCHPRSHAGQATKGS